MTTGVLFDLDGTLTPRRASIEAFAHVFAADHAEALAPVDREALARTLVAVDQGGYNKRRAEDLVETLEWRVAPAAAELDRYWRSHFADAVVPQPGLLDVLDGLRARGIATGLVTNGAVPGQTRKIERLGLAERLDAVVISEAVGCEKPDARIFEIACERLGVGPGDCWFVGDHPEKDIAGAERFGMRAVWITDAESGFAWPADADPPCHRIERLEELLAILG